MVSLRRRRLLGLCSGLPNSAVAPFPMYFDDEGVAQFGTPPASPVNAHPVPLTEEKQNAEIANSSTGRGSSNKLGPNSSMHQSNQTNGYGSTSSKQQQDQPSPDQETKPRKQHRRKHTHDQERCAMRGVYFKNMKWQAAIKVDKKQIHLGTVESQAEAARLYDRAAFMCGRAPNFELSEKDKQELKQLKWDEFLEKTRLEISSKKLRRRRAGAGLQDKSNITVLEAHNETGEGAEGALTSSEDAEPEEFAS